MQAVARCPKQLLIDEFGIGGEYLHDHANGIEPVRIADIKAYRPSVRSISSNQILFHDYDFAHARLVMSEMVELSIQRLVDQHLVSDEISLSIGYSRDILPRVHHSARRASAQMLIRCCCGNSGGCSMRMWTAMLRSVLSASAFSA
ncbi:MAG: hypothetical protein ACLTCB_04120 [Merdibacter sp.]